MDGISNRTTSDAPNYEAMLKMASSYQIDFQKMIQSGQFPQFPPTLPQQATGFGPMETNSSQQLQSGVPEALNGLMQMISGCHQNPAASAPVQQNFHPLVSPFQQYNDHVMNHNVSQALATAVAAAQQAPPHAINFPATAMPSLVNPLLGTGSSHPGQEIRGNTPLKPATSFGNMSSGSFPEAPLRSSGGGSDTKRTKDEDVASLVAKVQKRLAQNRESARKCRQRKKLYMTQLEEELLSLREQQKQAQHKELKALQANIAGRVGASGAPHSVECIAKLLNWKQQYVEAIDRLKAAMDNHADEEALKEQITCSLQLLKEEKRLKDECISKSMFYLVTGEHMLPEERLLLWMGGTKPSETLHFVVRDLQSRDMLTPHQHEQLIRFTESCTVQEDLVTNGFTTLKSQVLFGDGGQHSNDVNNFSSHRALGKLDAMGRFLQQANDLRDLHHTELEKILSPKQLAIALTTPPELLAQIQRLNEAYKSVSVSTNVGRWEHD